MSMAREEDATEGAAGGIMSRDRDGGGGVAVELTSEELLLENRRIAVVATPLTTWDGVPLSLIPAICSMIQTRRDVDYGILTRALVRLFRDPYYIKEAAFSEAINIIVEKRGGVWQVKDEYAGWAATQSEVSEDVLTGNFSMAQPDRAPAVQVMVPRAIPHKRKQATLLPSQSKIQKVTPTNAVTRPEQAESALSVLSSTASSRSSNFSSDNASELGNAVVAATSSSSSSSSSSSKHQALSGASTEEMTDTASKLLEN